MTKTRTKMQLRIESIVMGLLASIRGGHIMETISRATGYSADQIRPVMKALIAAGVVHRTGNTRGTRYMAVGL